jgi:hypothetical protein
MNKNKIFKVIWEVHVEREEIESQLSRFEGFHEGHIHDSVFSTALDKFEAGNPDVSRWEDENGKQLRHIMEHHLESYISGAVAFDEEALMKIPPGSWEDLLK